MKDYRRVGRWEFEWNKNTNQYECRGDVCYDDEHDETPDPSLWKAAKELANELKSEGINASPTWSEKGWVEVDVFVTAKS
jgi:hypothetical protein